MSPSRCAQATDDVALPKCTCHDWFVDALALIMLHVIGRHRLPDAHTPHLKRAGLGRYLLPSADACRPQPLTPSRCTHARPWLMLHVVGRRRLPDAHTPQLMRVGLGRCRLLLADARRPRPVTPSRCAHSTAYACRPWLMLHAGCRRRLPDAHMPRLMLASLGWCLLPLGDVAWPTPTCHVLCLDSDLVE